MLNHDVGQFVISFGDMVLFWVLSYNTRITGTKKYKPTGHHERIDN